MTAAPKPVATIWAAADPSLAATTHHDTEAAARAHAAIRNGALPDGVEVAVYQIPIHDLTDATPEEAA